MNLTATSQKIHAFFDWWISGLILLIPKNLRYKIFQAPDSLSIEVENDAMQFRYIREAENAVLHQRMLDFNDELEKKDIVRWLREIVDTGSRILVLVDEKKVLIKDLTFPLSSEPKIRNILVFEMDRQTPFSIEQVYYDYQIMDRDYQNKKLRLKLYVIPKNIIDAMLGKIHNLGLIPDNIHVYSGDEINSNVDLITASGRPREITNIDVPTRIIFVITCFLLFSVLYIPVLRYQKMLNILKNDVEQTRMEAMKVVPLKKEKEQILERNRFLSDIQTDRRSIMEILAELSRILPDNTFLNRLIINGNNIQLEGESNTATAILPLLEQSVMFKNAQFRSPVTRNDANSRDRFQVSADLTGKIFK